MEDVIGDLTSDEQRDIESRRKAVAAAGDIRAAVAELNAAADKLQSLLMTHKGLLHYEPEIEVVELAKRYVGQELAQHVGRLKLRMFRRAEELEPR